MLGQRDVILIGLGKFGASVSNNLLHMIEERSVQLGKIANSVILHTVNFANDEVFHSTDYMSCILDTIGDSQAYKTGEKFSIVIVGDLYESATAKYAIDFAYLPYLLQQTTSFKFSEVIGFFTFADQLGVTERPTSDESLPLISKYFDKLELINNNNSYTVPYKKGDGKKFKNVDTSSGPFDRNYLLITPGKSSVVADETGIVFAERIFYELFYLTQTMDEQSRSWHAERNNDNNTDKNLSCFSMVQIPRINEIQKYYLKYLFEKEIIHSFLKEPLKGTDNEYYRSKFFEMIDIPSKSSDFPIERACGLFIHRYRKNFSNVLTFYISGSNIDFKEYIEDCKKRIDDVVFTLLPFYDIFAQEEIDNLFKTLKSGFENLFKVDRINGNFKTYISFIESLKSTLKNWESSLNKNNYEVYDLNQDFNRVNEQITRLKKNLFLSFFPLRPIRQKLIENAILSLPVEKYLASLIEQKLSDAFYTYWSQLCEKNKSPISECDKILTNLNNLEKRFEDKDIYLSNKIKFIENMNDSYYILPMFEDSEDYKRLLDRIRDRNFGSHNKQNIKNAVSNALKLYVAERDIFSITQNPTEFINFIENKYISDNQNLFSDTEEKIDEFISFSKRAVNETQYKTENINSISFETSGTSLARLEMMLLPEKMKSDALSDEINANFETKLNPCFIKVEIPKDFSLGSVMYFKDYLYMSQNNMKKKDDFENYKGIKTSEPVYDESFIERNEIIEADDEDSLSELWKYTRALLMFYLDRSDVVNIYNEVFNDSKDSLTDEEIDSLSVAVGIGSVLEYLTDDQLNVFAKDNDVTVKSDREKQIKMILHEFSGR